jgi:hypothetical protein
MDSQDSQSVHTDESNREKMSVKYVQDSIDDMNYVICLLTDVRMDVLQGKHTKADGFDTMADILSSAFGHQDIDYAGRIAKSFLKESEVVKA